MWFESDLHRKVMSCSKTFDLYNKRETYERHTNRANVFSSVLVAFVYGFNQIKLYA